MSKIAADFGIQDALKALGIKDINEGSSTGSNNFSSGEIIASHSPVDGSLIAKVKGTTKEDYEKVMSTANRSFSNLENKTRTSTRGDCTSIWR